MPQIMKGDLEPTKSARSRYNWEEYFDGKQRKFIKGKDFETSKNFVSTVHQAAHRMGKKAMTRMDGEDVRVQVISGSLFSPAPGKRNYKKAAANRKAE